MRAPRPSPFRRGSKMLHIGQMKGVVLLMALLLYKSATPMQPNSIPNDRYQKTSKSIKISRSD
jgi:hypothetical protein